MKLYFFLLYSKMNHYILNRVKDGTDTWEVGTYNTVAAAAAAKLLTCV